MSRHVPGERGAGRRVRTPAERRQHDQRPHDQRQPERAAARRADADPDPDRPAPTVEPEINIVNLSDSEYQLLTAVRELGQGQIEVVVHSSRIVQITRSQRLPVAPTRAPRP